MKDRAYYLVLMFTVRYLPATAQVHLPMDEAPLTSISNQEITHLAPAMGPQANLLVEIAQLRLFQIPQGYVKAIAEANQELPLGFL